jgi:hypothetical protein
MVPLVAHVLVGRNVGGHFLCNGALEQALGALKQDMFQRRRNTLRALLFQLNFVLLFHGYPVG